MYPKGNAIEQRPENGVGAHKDRSRTEGTGRVQRIGGEAYLSFIDLGSEEHNPTAAANVQRWRMIGGESERQVNRISKSPHKIL